MAGPVNLRSLEDWLTPTRPPTAHPTRSAQSWLGAWTDALPRAEPPKRELASEPPGDRARAETTARAFVDALRLGDPARIRAVTSDPMWLAGEGGDRWVGQADLSTALSDHAPPFPQGRPREVRSYDLPALRQILPATVSRALEDRLPLSGARVVCVTVDGGRFSLLAAPAGSAVAPFGWTIRSLPWTAVDIAWRASARVCTDDDAAPRIAHPVVMRLVWGPRGGLRSLRNQLMESIVTSDGPRLAERLDTLTEDTPAFGRLLSVVGATRRAPPPPQAAPIEAGVRALYGPFNPELRPTWTVTSISNLADPARTEQWHALMVTVPERAGPPRTAVRLAGLLRT